MGLRRQIFAIQLVTLAIVSSGGLAGWWIAQSMGRQATRNTMRAQRQSYALNELSIALLESLPFSAHYLTSPSLPALDQHLSQDIAGLHRFRRQLDSQFAALALDGLHPDVHNELEEIRLLNVQAEGALRSSHQQVLRAHGGLESLPPGFVKATVRNPNLTALQGHSRRLNLLLQRLEQQVRQHQREQVAAIAAGGRVMVLALLLAWVAGLVFAWRTSQRILQPLRLLELRMRQLVAQEDRAPVGLPPFEKAPQEIASLASSFNQMGRRLASLVARLEDLALTDSLTQVGNRRRFDQFLTQEWFRLQRRGQPLSLLMIDVDHFKAYNDTYGHGQGDSCLIQIAEAIRRQGRRCTDLTCRIGGEEFAMVLPETDLAVAGTIGHLIWKAVGDLGLPHQGLGSEGRVSVSIGVATAHPSPQGTQDDLLQRADQALYCRKQRQGRNGVTVTAMPLLMVPAPTDLSLPAE